ncbi:ABC transporter permease [Marinilabiliaceae bacterium ANBcel2]|nr:ABC transporter permease [Marinilabiliaceae bacterium ANBcel2]
MKLELFIANKISSGGVSGKNLAGPVLKVAVAGIILGIVVMILSIAVGSGFKHEIREKITGFGGHISVVNYDFNLSYEPNPITDDAALYNKLGSLDGVDHIQRFASKPGLIKGEQDMQGIVLKGVGSEYNPHFLESILVEGAIPEYCDQETSDEILVSAVVADMLQLSLGDEVFVYFFQEQIRVRRFSIAAIFDSQLPDMDKMYVIADINQVKRLNNWDDDQIAGYEIIAADFDRMEQVGREVRDIVSTYISDDGMLLRSQTIRQTEPQVFGWLDLLDMNIVVIIVLIIMVAGFNMISGLLILILERTNMIGVLKAIGIENWSLRKVFIVLAIKIGLRGLIWGNIIGIGLCLLQLSFGFIKLDPESYFLDTVPVLLNPVHIILLNIGAVFAILLMMIGPSYLAARISPVKAIMFD